MSKVSTRLNADSSRDLEKFDDVQSPFPCFKSGDERLVLTQAFRQLLLRQPCGFPREL